VRRRFVTTTDPHVQNGAAAAQGAHFIALGQQPELAILLYDENLRHRLTKRLTNSTAEHIPTIVAEAERLLAVIPFGQTFRFL
jgi:hypothetical protein